MTEEKKDAYIKKLVQSNIDQQNKIALLSAKVYKLQKENAKVEEIKANADYKLEGRDLEIKELKETYRKQRNKRIDELQKENAELKKLKRECETSLCRAEYQYNYEQLTKAKEIISEFVEWATWQGSNCPSFKSIQDKAEQFLKGEITTEQSNECHDCAKFDEMPNGPRCKTCDNGSSFQKKEEA